jgi:hypothetical protein
MAMFLHFAPESALTSIRRRGIARSRRRSCGDWPRGTYAVPVTRNFYISHQWLRELKRRKGGSIVGVYFRVGDDEVVWVGHYNQTHRRMTAAEALAEFMSAESREGWEVIIPRRIEPEEIHRTKFLSQVLGWRYFPGAKGQRPFCACDFCTRGEFGARRLRARLGVPA